MAKGDPRYREVILDNLRRIDRERGCVSNEQVRRAAPLLGVTERHVRKLIRKQTKDRKGPWAPDDKVIDVFYATKGNIAATVRECEEQKMPIDVKERQAQRAFDRFVDRTLIGGARGGVDGFRKAMLTVPVDIPHRNAQWAMDHTIAPCLANHVGRTVEVRAMRRNEDHIEVFLGRTHIGRVGLAKDQTDASRGRLIGVRLAQEKRHSAHVRQGDIINARKLRELLSDLGVAEEDLPEVPPAPGDEDEQQPSGRRKTGKPSSKQRKARAKTTAELADHIDDQSNPNGNGRKTRANGNGASNGNGHGTATDTAAASPDALASDGRATATAALLDLIDSPEN